MSEENEDSGSDKPKAPPPMTDRKELATNSRREPEHDQPPKEQPGDKETKE